MNRSKQRGHPDPAAIGDPANAPRRAATSSPPVALDDLHLDAVFLAIPHLFFLVDADDTYLAYRAGRASPLYVDPSEFIGRRVDAVLPEPTAGILLEANHRARTRREQVIVEYTLPMAGVETRFEARIAPLDAGRIAALVIDITERGRSERALRERESLLRTILDTEPECVKLVSPDGQLLQMNPAGLAMLEIESIDEAGSLLDFVVPEDRDAFAELNRRVLMGETRHLVFRIVGRRGTPRWLETTAAPLRADDDAVTTVLAVTRDITESRHALAEQKRSADALRVSEELHRALFDANPFPIWAYDTDTLAFLTVNDAAIRHYGFSREEFMRMTVRDIRPAEERERFDAFMERFRGQAGAVTHQTRHRRKDGSTIDVEVTGGGVVFQGRPARMVTVHDVTDQLRLEDELRRAQKLESIGRLAGGIAHDFNNLLTAILGYAQLMEKRLEAEPELLADLGEIRRAGERARDLTQQLLAVARRQVTAPSVLDVNALAASMERLLHRLLGEHIVLRTRFATGLWPTKADPGQIEQILMNLAVNARDAMPDGGTLTIETGNVDLDGSAPAAAGLVPGPYVMIEVRDTGVGMSEETLAHVFEPFYTTKRVGEGTGLGLATVYGIMQQSGGRVWVESELGQGTTFRLYFPRAHEPLPAGASAGEPGTRGGHETVLVVEDDAAVRALTVRALEDAGYRVAVAEHGAAAIDIATRMHGPIDLLVTDVVMPELSGHDVAQRLIKSRPNLPVLYVSGYAPHSVMPPGALNDGVLFLPKPFTPAALLRKVRALLDAKGTA